jgi:hypothetical protein
LIDAVQILARLIITAKTGSGAKTSGLNAETDPELKFVVVVTEHVLNRARREHFLRGHRFLLR